MKSRYHHNNLYHLESDTIDESPENRIIHGASGPCCVFARTHKRQVQERCSFQLCPIKNHRICFKNIVLEASSTMCLSLSFPLQDYIEDPMMCE